MNPQRRVGRQQPRLRQRPRRILRTKSALLSGPGVGSSARWRSPRTSAGSHPAKPTTPPHGDRRRRHHDPQQRRQHLRHVCRKGSSGGVAQREHERDAQRDGRPRTKRRSKHASSNMAPPSNLWHDGAVRPGSRGGSEPSAGQRADQRAHDRYGLFPYRLAIIPVGSATFYSRRRLLVTAPVVEGSGARVRYHLVRRHAERSAALHRTDPGISLRLRSDRAPTARTGPCPTPPATPSAVSRLPDPDRAAAGHDLPLRARRIELRRRRLIRPGRDVHDAPTGPTRREHRRRRGNPGHQRGADRRGEPRRPRDDLPLRIRNHAAYGSSWPGVQVFAGSGSTAQPIAVTVPNLQARASYHYRLVASNEDGTSYGADQTFTTPAYPASVIQEAPMLTTNLGFVNPEPRSSASRRPPPRSGPRAGQSAEGV